MIELLGNIPNLPTIIFGAAIFALLIFGLHNVRFDLLRGKPLNIFQTLFWGVGLYILVVDVVFADWTFALKLTATFLGGVLAVYGVTRLPRLVVYIITILCVIALVAIWHNPWIATGMFLIAIAGGLADVIGYHIDNVGANSTKLRMRQDGNSQKSRTDQ